MKTAATTRITASSATTALTIRGTK